MKKENEVDPKKDWVFKLMFTHGKMGNTALIDFLNAFLADSYGSITQADVLNTELIKDAPNGETYRLDFLIKTDIKLLINLEMQQFWQTSYPNRIQLYSYRMASRFLKLHPKDDDPNYAISFTVFGCDVPKTSALPHTSKTAMIQYVYVELNKLISYTLNKEINDYTKKDYWIRFLAHYKQDKESGMLEDLCKREKGINGANQVLLTVTEEERRIARELSEENYQMMLSLEREVARKEGLAEGRKEGIKEGLEEGRAEGAYQRALETARILKQLDDPISKIMQATGLSEEEIEKL